MDFTLEKYRELLIALQENGYQFLKMEDLAAAQQEGKTLNKYVVLRHDVDKLPRNARDMAMIESVLGIKATYYFRIVKDSNEPTYIRDIAILGHEIGYHYEDLTLANGDIEKAYELFTKHLTYFRQYYPVSTICMHGSPRSPYDSKDIWNNYDYHALNILMEPYLDIDYANVFYLTDTGRRWDGWKVSVRDKIPIYQDQWIKDGRVFHKTQDIIQVLRAGQGEVVLGNQVLITTHPQRWTDQPISWLMEFGLQNIKNIIKKRIISRNAEQDK